MKHHVSLSFKALNLSDIASIHLGNVITNLDDFGIGMLEAETARAYLGLALKMPKAPLIALEIGGGVEISSLYTLENATTNNKL